MRSLWFEPVAGKPRPVQSIQYMGATSSKACYASAILIETHLWIAPLPSPCWIAQQSAEMFYCSQGRSPEPVEQQRQREVKQPSKRPRTAASSAALHSVATKVTIRVVKGRIVGRKRLNMQRRALGCWHTSLKTYEKTLPKKLIGGAAAGPHTSSLPQSSIGFILSQRGIEACVQPCSRRYVQFGYKYILCGF